MDVGDRIPRNEAEYDAWIASVRASNPDMGQPPGWNELIAFNTYHANKRREWWERKTPFQRLWCVLSGDDY